jgi:hypothetical protein
MKCYKCRSEGLYQCSKCDNKTCFDHMWYDACSRCWADMTKDWIPFPEPLEDLK